MAVSENPVSAPPEAPKKTSTGKKIALGCGGAAIVAALLALVLTVVVKKATAGPEAVVKEFLAAAAAGEEHTPESVSALLRVLGVSPLTLAIYGTVAVTIVPSSHPRVRAAITPEAPFLNGTSHIRVPVSTCRMS